jgi:truncated hemoglobin YjbI
MNAISRQPESDMVDHNLTGFGIEELSRNDWLEGMRGALTGLGVPANTRRALEPALTHFADEVGPDLAAQNVQQFFFAQAVIVRRGA